MEPYDQKPRPLNQYPSSYEKPRNTGKIVLAVVAFAAIALAVGVANNSPESLTPVSETAMGTGVYDDPASRASSIEPAEGEAFRENKSPVPSESGTAVAPAVQPPGATTTNPTPPATPEVTTVPSEPASPAIAVPPPVQSYSSEQECKDATSTACHSVDQKTWQAVVPAMDNTTVPEQVNPPLTGQ